jgi:ABC-type branched-subunit amino acid transport system permease subunit
MKGREQESGLLSLLQITATAIASFIVFFFVLPHHPWTGGAVSVCVIGDITAARACWDSRHHLWFWLTLAVTAFVQSAIIILVPWPETRFPGIVLLPIGLVDYAVVYGVMRFVESFRSGKAEACPK